MALPPHYGGGLGRGSILNMEEVKKYLEDAEEKMEFAAMHLEEALSRIRAGRANVHILDEVRVDSYGSMVPLSNVASLNTPDARSITIKPWEKSMLKVIEKAIIDPSSTRRSASCPRTTANSSVSASLP